MKKYIVTLLVAMSLIKGIAASPTWSLTPSQFEFSMTITAIVEVDHAMSDDVNDLLSVWSNGQLRGVSSPFYVSSLDTYFYSLLIYSNAAGDSLDFKYYDASADSIINLSNTEVFVLDGNLGSYANPYELGKLVREIDLLSFDIGTVQKSISTDADNHTVTITVFESTDVTDLVASYSFKNGDVVKVADSTQTSGVTSNDFTTPLTYQISNSTGESATWTVEVEVEKVILEISLVSFGFGTAQKELTIDTLSRRISGIVYEASDLTSLVANFEFINADSVKVNAVLQTSGVTSNDFSTPIQYKLSNASGDAQTWTVELNVENAIREINLLSFDFGAIKQNLTIDTDNHKISGVVSANADLTSLVAEFLFTNADTVKVNNILQVSGETSNDFTSIVQYKITNTSGESEVWSVEMTQVIPVLEHFTFKKAEGIYSIDTTAQYILFTAYQSIDLTALIARYQFSDIVNAAIDHYNQISNVTDNDFSSGALEYVLTSTFDEEFVWTVEVQQFVPSFTAFSFDGQNTVFTIDADAKTIMVSVAAELDLTNMIASFSTENTDSVLVLDSLQTSGVTENDFSLTVYYILINEVGEHVAWTVNVQKAVGLQEEAEALGIQIYPNPTSSFATLNLEAFESSSLQITILDQSGSTLHIENADLFDNALIILDLTSYTEGVYTVLVSDATKTIAQRVVVQ